jgi:1,4-dihydroxy-2-naphthoate octaprenyltransferase
MPESVLSRSRTASSLRRTERWFTAARPWNVAFVAEAVLPGLAIARLTQPLVTWRAIVPAVTIAAWLVAARYINEYEDFVRGVDDPERLKPISAVAQGLPIRRVRTIGLISLAVAAALGSLVTYQRNPWLIIGVLATLSVAYFYSGGPVPLSHYCLGEIMEFCFQGVLPTAWVAYVNGAKVSGAVFVAGIAVGFASSTVLLVNNLRDISTDRAGGKVTVPQLVSYRTVRVIFIASVCIPYLLFIVLSVLFGTWSWMWCWVTLPLALSVIRRFIKANDNWDDLMSVHVGLRQWLLVLFLPFALAIFVSHGW